jgi:endonuclease/exonuclease/phosphatase family protein
VRHTLRVVTFNLRWGREVDRAADLLSRPGPLSDADVLVLQEMDRPGTERLARTLGFAYVYVPSAFHPVPKKDFGVAILSPWPIEDARKLLLPHESRFRKLRRSAAVATVRSPLGPVRVYGVHLETPTGASNRVRREQARTVLADAVDWAGPVIVAGDFNGRSGAAELAGAGFSWLTETVTNTMGLFDLDQIVARGLCPAAPARPRSKRTRRTRATTSRSGRSSRRAGERTSETGPRNSREGVRRKGDTPRPGGAGAPPGVGCVSGFGGPPHGFVVVKHAPQPASFVQSGGGPAAANMKAEQRVVDVVLVVGAVSPRVVGDEAARAHQRPARPVLAASTAARPSSAWPVPRALPTPS